MKNNFTGKIIKKRKNISTTGTFSIESIQSPTEFVFGTKIDEEPKKPEKQKPSQTIKENASKKEDWSDPCGAHNCKCYEHELLLEAILEYLDNIPIHQ